MRGGGRLNGNQECEGGDYQTVLQPYEGDRSRTPIRGQ